MSGNQLRVVTQAFNNAGMAVKLYTVRYTFTSLLE